MAYARIGASGLQQDILHPPWRRKLAGLVNLPPELNEMHNSGIETPTLIGKNSHGRAGKGNLALTNCIGRDSDRARVTQDSRIVKVVKLDLLHLRADYAFTSTNSHFASTIEPFSNRRSSSDS